MTANVVVIGLGAGALVASLPAAAAAALLLRVPKGAFADASELKDGAVVA